VIVIDASAIVAILQKEDRFDDLVAKLIGSEARRASPVSLVELTMALARTRVEPVEFIDASLRSLGIDILPVDADQAYWARYAYLTYGKGRHAARLNLGDCFSYAAAKSLNAPLLYVGGDFVKTDIRTA
jgi:ribonuclease VapC